MLIVKLNSHHIEDENNRWIYNYAQQEQLNQQPNWQNSLTNWGYSPKGIYDDNYYRWYDQLGTQLSTNPLFLKLNPQQLRFIIAELAEQFLPLLKEHIINTTDFSYPLDIGLPTDQSMNFHAEINKTVTQLANNINLTDPELIENLSTFISHEIEGTMDQMLTQEIQNETFFVRVYGMSRAFGGAEEGGWWYNQFTPVEEEQIAGLQQAIQRKEQLTQQWQNSGRDSFYDDLERGYAGVTDLYNEANETATGLGDLNYNTQDVEGMDFPAGWTTSEYEKFSVTVELSQNPILVQPRPRYE